MPALKACGTAVMISLLICPMTLCAAQAALSDEQAARELTAAQPAIDSMQRVLQQELPRILHGDSGPLPPEAAQLLNPVTAVPDIGDVRVPLHLRLIELYRRDFVVAGFALAQDAVSGHCEAADPRPDRLLQAESRAKARGSIQCERDQMERFQVGMHEVNKNHEAHLLALHLPPATQDRWLAAARESTGRQDDNLESDYSARRASLATREEYIKFIGDHAARIHFVDGRIEFDDPADLKSSQEIGERLRASAQY